MGIPSEIALQKYSNGVLYDSQAWGEEGIVDFYPDIDKNFIKYVYNFCIEEWKGGKVVSPLQYIKKLTS